MVQGVCSAPPAPGAVPNQGWLGCGWSHTCPTRQELALGNGEDTLSIAALELLVPVAWGVVSPHSLELYGLGVICSRYTENVCLCSQLWDSGRGW